MIFEASVQVNWILLVSIDGFVVVLSALINGAADTKVNTYNDFVEDKLVPWTFKIKLPSFVISDVTAEIVETGTVNCLEAVVPSLPVPSIVNVFPITLAYVASKVTCVADAAGDVDNVHSFESVLFSLNFHLLISVGNLEPEIVTITLSFCTFVETELIWISEACLEKLTLISNVSVHSPILIVPTKVIFFVLAGSIAEMLDNVLFSILKLLLLFSFKVHLILVLPSYPWYPSNASPNCGGNVIFMNCDEFEAFLLNSKFIAKDSVLLIETFALFESFISIFWLSPWYPWKALLFEEIADGANGVETPKITPSPLHKKENFLPWVSFLFALK